MKCPFGFKYTLEMESGYWRLTLIEAAGYELLHIRQRRCCAKEDVADDISRFVVDFSHSPTYDSTSVENEGAPWL